jgi:UMP-CMP kinase
MVLMTLRIHPITDMNVSYLLHIFFKSGQGTQSDLIFENYPCVHLSAGQLLRDETSKEGSPHGKMIEECLVAGKIVPVEISLALLAQAIQDAPGKSMIFLVDGFPRNYDNLDGWTKGMANIASVAGVLHYDCPLEILEKRILERAKDSGRSDDNLESLRKRFKTFKTDTEPVIDMLRRVAAKSTSMQVFEIEANRPIKSVWEDTQASLNSVIADDILAQNNKLLDAIAAKDADKYVQLCAKEMVERCEPKEFLKNQELSESTDARPDCISKAQMEFISGTKAKVSYRRSLGESVFQESRIWSHTEEGWKMIHFFRSPLEVNQT